jgi:hypothetical protein
VGAEVVFVDRQAYLDGLYGGDNLVDETAISWIQSAIHFKGANASVLWIDEPAKFLKWRVNPIVKAALAGCDVMINHSFDLVTEEMLEFRELLKQYKLPMVRNFATTAPLLGTAWALLTLEFVFPDITPPKVWSIETANPAGKKKMAEALKEIIIGQDEPIEKLTKAIRRTRAGLKDPKRPIGSFISWGPPASERQNWPAAWQSSCLVARIP